MDNIDNKDNDKEIKIYYFDILIIIISFIGFLVYINI